MRKSNWTPSIVPSGYDQTVYQVMQDLGRLGRIWPEADVERTDLENLLSEQYGNPICVIAFNTTEHAGRFGRCRPRV